uniref:Uncharacterized protein n=1 Tax=Timema tahoe TaxID=61484 RepID=A0A7R9FL92_9NEOP|nr:unnamed protein product [Timema tahoe]
MGARSVGATACTLATEKKEELDKSKFVCSFEVVRMFTLLTLKGSSHTLTGYTMVRLRATVIGHGKTAAGIIQGCLSERPKEKCLSGWHRFYFLCDLCPPRKELEQPWHQFGGTTC